MTRFVLIRHGSTYWNKEKRMQGHANNPLCEEGFEQAEAVGKRLSAEKWDAIFSSDLLRSMQTSQTIAKQLGMDQINEDVRLREMNRGLVEGTTLEERIARWGEDWLHLDLGIEQAEQGMLRGAECLREIAAAHPDGQVLIISHGIILRHTMKGVIPQLDTDTVLDNTSITEILVRDGEWSCPLYNCTAHLREAIKVE